MSTFEIILLVIVVIAEGIFWVARGYFSLTKPKFVKGTNHTERYRAWSKKAEKFEKLANPLALHIIAGSALAVWVVIRVVISFI